MKILFREFNNCHSDRILSFPPKSGNLDNVTGYWIPIFMGMTDRDPSRQRRAGVEKRSLGMTNSNKTNLSV